MEWKNNLHEALKHRLDPNDLSKDEYNKLIKEVVKPSLREIRNFLYKYRVDVIIDQNESKFYVPLYASKTKLFGMDFIQEGDKVIIEISHYSYVSLMEELQTVNRVDKEIIAINEFTGDTVGELFIKHFQGYLKYFIKGN